MRGEGRDRFQRRRRLRLREVDPVGAAVGGDNNLLLDPRSTPFLKSEKLLN
jgi:hypothetical protein